MFRNLLKVLAIGSSFILATLSSLPAMSASNMMFFTGTQLYNLCRSPESGKQLICEGYILGVNDTIHSGYLSDHFNLCFPKGVEPSQLRLQVINFMENNPDVMHFVAEGIVAKTLELKYPCQKEESK